MTQVAVTEVAVVPVFKGFRSIVTKVTEGSAKTASQGFSRAFAQTGTDSGKKTGAGFKSAFEQSAKGASSKVTKALEADVAKASRALSAARLKEQDAAGRTKVAEAQLAEARKKYAADSSQVIRAQERMAAASRQLASAHDKTEDATDDLKKAQSELARAADRAGDELSEAGSRGVSGFRSSVVGGVKSFAGPLVAAFAALGIGRIVTNAFSEAKDFVLDSITLASGLEQSVGAVDAVFKDSARSIHQWALTADQAVGLSTNSYNELATVIGAQLKNMGYPLEEVAEQTGTLIELGADLSAQFGGSTADAVSALSSLLRGERDPIERYGVSINEAAVKAEALSLGLAGVVVDQDKVTAAHMRAIVTQRKYDEAVEKFGDSSTQALSLYGNLTSANAALESALAGSTVELTNQQKAQATLSLLMKQTEDAQGTFGRESDTLAGKQQRAAAAWENVSTKIGEAFLPVASEVVDILNKDLIPAIADIAEDQGPALAQAFADVLPDLAELAKELLPQLPGLLKATADSLPAIVALIGLLSPLLIDGAEGWNGMIASVGGFFDLISGNTSPEELYAKMVALQGPVGDAARWFSDAGLQMGQAVGTAARVVGEGADQIVGFVTSIPARAVEALGDLGDLLYDSGLALMGGFKRGIDDMFGPIGEAVSGALDWLVGFFPHSPAKRGPLSGSGWADLKKSGGAFWDQWVGGIGGGDGPEFPTFDGGGPSGSSGSGATGSTSMSGGRSVSQTNYFDKTDPNEAVELSKQQLAAILRGA